MLRVNEEMRAMGHGRVLFLTSSAILLACTGGQSGNEGSAGLDSGTDASTNSSPHTGSRSDGGIEYTEIMAGGSATSQADVGFCDLVRHPMFETAGLYRVASLTSVVEEDVANPGSQVPFTYVELSLLEAWHLADGDTVARITGGRLPSGVTALWMVSLKVGEPVGLLLMRRIPENRDFYGIHNLGTFTKGANGGFTNGQLFTSHVVDAAMLGTMVKAVSEAPESDPCPFDEEPDYRLSEINDELDGGP